MPAFLVHGNPDSARLWSRTIANLGDYEGEIVAADLPGFAKARRRGSRGPRRPTSTGSPSGWKS